MRFIAKGTQYVIPYLATVQFWYYIADYAEREGMQCVCVVYCVQLAGLDRWHCINCDLIDQCLCINKQLIQNQIQKSMSKC